MDGIEGHLIDTVTEFQIEFFWVILISPIHKFNFEKTKMNTLKPQGKKCAGNSSGSKDKTL